MTEAAAPAHPLRLRHALEAAGVYLLTLLCRALPLGAASGLGGSLARTFGPRLGITQRAARHYARAFPDATPADVTQAMRAMWDNLGRTVFEYPNLNRIACYTGSRVQVTGAEYIDALRDDGRAGIFFSGHIANWEIMPLAVAQRGCDISLVYRAANNPHVDAMILRARGAITHTHVPKGTPGARQMVKIVKYDVPLVPCAVRRTGGAHFAVTIHPPLALPNSGDRDADVRSLMTTINTFLEDAIRANPPHWMWLHRRWVD
jgi:KDO2-lipid IV(A) lauroyltransferase